MKEKHAKIAYVMKSTIKNMGIITVTTTMIVMRSYLYIAGLVLYIIGWFFILRGTTEYLFIQLVLIWLPRNNGRY